MLALRYFVFFHWPRLVILTMLAIVVLFHGAAHADAVSAAPAATVAIPAGSLLAQIVGVGALIVGTPLAAALAALFVRLAKQAGVQIDDAYRQRLDEMILNGIHMGAAKAGASLYGGALDVHLKPGILADAADYVAVHGADTLKALQADPGSLRNIDAIVAARFEKWFGASGSPAGSAASAALVPSSGGGGG